MASIKTRVAGLEQASKVTVKRQLTDAERAVRLTHILNNPESSPMYGPLTEILKKAVVAVELLLRVFLLIFCLPVLCPSTPLPRRNTTLM
jgi:hypothetical protein